MPFKLPYGAVRFALGAQWRRETINDVPGEAIDPNLMNNIWGSTRRASPPDTRRPRSSSAKSKFRCSGTCPGIQNLTLNGAARLTNVDARSPGR